MQNRPAKPIRNTLSYILTEERVGVPSKMVWMSMSVKNAVTLLNGRYDFDETGPSAGPSLVLNRVLYVYLTSGKQLDAVAVLGYHTGATAYWDYVYAFSLASGSPTLTGCLRTGSRADFGLHGVEITNGGLIVDLSDPERQIADCCSEGFVRTTDTFRNGYFVQSGPEQFGTMNEPKPRLADKPDR